MLEQSFIETYQNIGAMGVMLLLFIGMIHFLKGALMAKLNEVSDITIKLIDRNNRFEKSMVEKVDKFEDALSDKLDRRHEKMTETIDELSNQINYMQGRINGGSK